MALSVRLDPVIEARIEQATRRLGITESAFVKDAIERVLGLKDGRCTGWPPTAASTAS